VDIPALHYDLGALPFFTSSVQMDQAILCISISLWLLVGLPSSSSTKSIVTFSPCDTQTLPHSAPLQPTWKAFAGLLESHPVMLIPEFDMWKVRLPKW
jgi:hypothetical protein